MNRNYEESWNQASSMFRREVTQERWLAAGAPRKNLENSTREGVR
jgi:hypothetical protein